MNQEPQPEEYIRRPLEGLTEAELNEITLAIQEQRRRLDDDYGVVMQERTYRYVERLGRLH